MDNKEPKEVHLKVGQIWRVPIPYMRETIAEGFYLIERKNSHNMWYTTRLFTTPIISDDLYDIRKNKFTHKSMIVERGTLVGTKKNLKAIQILFMENTEK